MSTSIPRIPSTSGVGNLGGATTLPSTTPPGTPPGTSIAAVQDTGLPGSKPASLRSSIDSAHVAMRAPLPTARPASAASTVSVPQDPGVLPFPKTVDIFQQRLDADAVRPIKRAAVAAMINQHRSNPYAANTDHTQTHQTRAKGLSAADRQKWADALGVTAEQWKATEVMSKLAGHLVPMGGILTNLAVYAAVPYATMGVENPWVNAGISLGLAVVQPLLTSAMQPFVVQAQEGWRQKHAPSVKRDKTILSASQTKHELRAAIDTAAGNVRTGAQTIANQLTSWSTKYNIAPPADGSQEAIAATLKNLHAKLDPDEQVQFQTMCTQQFQAMTSLGALEVKLDGLSGLNSRENVARQGQIVPRFVRGASGFGTPFLRHLPTTPSWLDGVKTDSRWSPAQTTGLSIGVAITGLLGQLFAAGYDEKSRAMPADANMNILYADVLNAQGQADWRAGRQITADGIDETKCRGLMTSPEAATLARVTTIVKAKLARAEKALAKLENVVGVEEGTIASQKYLKAKEKVRKLKSDVAQLDAGKVGQLEPGGDAHRLLGNAMKSTAFMFAWQDGLNKLRSGDFSVQLAERIAQSLLLLSFGNLAVLALGRVALAGMGGGSVAPLSTQLGLQLATSVIGLISASLIFAASNTKARTREGGDMGFASQVGWGIVSPLTEATGAHDEHKAKQILADAMAQHLRDAAGAMEVLRDLSEGDEPGGREGTDSPKGPRALTLQAMMEELGTPGRAESSTAGAQRAAEAAAVLRAADQEGEPRIAVRGGSSRRAGSRQPAVLARPGSGVESIEMSRMSETARGKLAEDPGKDKLA